MKNYSSQYFTKKERGSLLLLAGFTLLLLLALGLIYKYDKPASYKMDNLVEHRIIDSLKNANNKNDFYNKEKNEKINNESRKNPEEFKKFNPNTVPVEDLRRMGVDKFASSNLDKYRQKGGRIKSKDQFFKIYGMEKFRPLLDSLLEMESQTSNRKDFTSQATDPLSNNSSVNSANPEPKFKPFQKDTLTYKKKPYQNDASQIQVVKLKIVELNGADSFELESIKGVGQYLASRIVKYRNKLGGFYEIEQLEEVYGLRPETYLKIDYLVKVDRELIKKIPINKADEKTLAAHPYIGRKTAGILMRYKANHGDYKSVEDLKKVRIFDDEDISKLKWYISFE